jgi:hypothetical protein
MNISGQLFNKAKLNHLKTDPNEYGNIKSDNAMDW